MDYPTAPDDTMPKVVAPAQTSSGTNQPVAAPMPAPKPAPPPSPVPVVNAPMSKFSFPLQKADQPIETLDVARAKRIMNKLTADPSWLAAPRTAAAANSVLGAASKVLSMHMQLEAANRNTEAAITHQALVQHQLAMADELATYDPATAAIFFKPHDDGKLPATDIANFADISQALKNAKDLAKTRAENEAARLANQSESERQAAVAVATAKGDKIATTTGPKGTTTTITTVPPAGDLKPNILELGNGNKIAWSPKTGKFIVVKPNGKTDEFNVPQMRLFSEELRARNDKYADKVDTYLKDILEKKMNPTAPATDVNGLPPKVDAAPSGIPKISTKEQRDALKPGTQYIGPDGKTYTRQ